MANMYLLRLTNLVVLWVSTCQCQLAYEAVAEGQSSNPFIESLDTPFVPEDFRSSPKRIIFDKADFVNLLPSSDLRTPLRDAILTVLVETQQQGGNYSKIYNDMILTYAGMAKLGGRPGHSAHFAATVKIQVCERNLTLCHFEECDLDLDQKEAADPHDYRPQLTLHSKECSRLDSWCYFCRNYDNDDMPMSGPNRCSGRKALPAKRNCNAKKGDLSVNEKWGCITTFTVVAGQTEVIAKDCEAIPHDSSADSCTSLDNSDYEVACTCHLGSGCNHRDDAVAVAYNNDPILSEVNRSIRQLRADLKKTIQRYSKLQNGEDDEE